MNSSITFNQTTQFNFELSSLRIVPSNLNPPPHITMKQYKPSNSISIITSNEDIQKLKYAGRVASKVLSKAIQAIKTNQCSSGDEVDELVHNEIIKHNCYPSSLGFKGFPKSLCISANDSMNLTKVITSLVICHGIPNKSIFKQGDFINLDLTVYYKGIHADTSAMVVIGNIDQRIQSLVRSTSLLKIDKARMAMFKGINTCKSNAFVSVIGKTIEVYLKENKLIVCKEFCGHGIGKEIHMKPLIPHYDQQDKENDIQMKPGMVFTIEPIVLMNDYYSNLAILPDKWSIKSKGNPSAQWEHTILITNQGYDIITLRDNEFPLI